jgi:cell division protein FtsB
MSLGLQDSRRRRRHQRRIALIKWLLVLIFLGGAGAFAYATGSKLARLEVEDLEQQVAELKATRADLKNEKAQLQAKLQTTQEELGTWKERYKANVPQGEPAELFSLMKRRLNNGVDAERLTFVIQQAQSEASCDAGPETRRFLVQTPLSDGAADSVSFANNRVTVTARGASAKDAQGRPEAWFDPDQPVTVTIRRPGGDARSLKGTLPLHPAVVAQGDEHRFSVIPGDRRGFVEVTWQRCAYP